MTRHGDSPEVPLPALALACAGLIPFAAGTAAMLFGEDWLRLTAYLHMMNYAAVVLTFIGAVHWGLAAAAAGRGAHVSWHWYAGGAAPALLGWASLALIHPVTRIVVVAAGFVGVFLLDLAAERAGFAPSWYARLRKPLTIVVLIVLGAAGVVAT